MPCCNHQCYNNAFDAQLAQTELDEYLTTGLKKSSLPFFETMAGLPLDGKTLLDIGGGIGAVTFELFKKGIRHATHVDISKAYVDIFQKEAAKRALTEKTDSLHGNFPDLQSQAPGTDLVMLDKVFCCYENYRDLAQASISKARRWYIYSIPRDVWWVRLRFWKDSLIDRLKGRYMHTFYHPNEGINEIIESAGFQKKEERLADEWRITLFEKGV